MIDNEHKHLKVQWFLYCKVIIPTVALTVAGMGVAIAVARLFV